MKRLFIIPLLVAALLLSGPVAYAQNNKGKKPTTSKNSKNNPPKKTIEYTQLPANSNDCLFAIDLQADVTYGPTTAPKGAGRIQEIMRDKNNPNLFEYEHNSTWYKFTVPYSGNLQIDITPNYEWDDYDFIVYKYTDQYFSNHLIQNKIKPVAACLSVRDTIGMASTMTKTSKGVVRPKNNHLPTRPLLGMRPEGQKTFVGPRDTNTYVKSIPVKKGDVYYIVLDNKTNNGDGHSIKASIQIDAYNVDLSFYDPKIKQVLEVDLLILEKNTGDRAIVKNPKFRNSVVKFVPKFTYTIYAKKEGYFPIYREISANALREYPELRLIMSSAKKGTIFSLSDIYFDDEANLLPESDTTLMNYIQKFSSYPELTFQVKGYVQSYGIDMEAEQKLSIARAQSVKDFFVKNGISEDRITVAGMTVNEIKRAATAALNKGQTFKDTKVEIIITGLNNH